MFRPGPYSDVCVAFISGTTALEEGICFKCQTFLILVIMLAS